MTSKETLPPQSEERTEKLPAIQFYPGDWKKDPGIQALDRVSRSVWFDLLLLMHESEERGVLLLNGVPFPEEALAITLNLDNQTLSTILQKIVSYGVASRRESDGAIFNRRMVRDEELRQKRRIAGLLGGNPNLVKQNTTKTAKRVKQITTPSLSSSTSSSTSSSELESLPPEQGEPPKPKPEKTLHGNFIYLSEPEVLALEAKHGADVVAEAIEKLDGWIGSDPTPKRIRNGRNAAATIRTWVIKAVLEDRLRVTRNGPNKNQNGLYVNKAQAMQDANVEALRVWLASSKGDA